MHRRLWYGFEVIFLQKIFEYCNRNDSEFNFYSKSERPGIIQFRNYRKSFDPNRTIHTGRRSSIVMDGGRGSQQATNTVIIGEETITTGLGRDKYSLRRRPIQHTTSIARYIFHNTNTTTNPNPNPNTNSRTQQQKEFVFTSQF